MDFFSYLKDILAGKNGITYTFSDTLGGDTLAIFSYYLASPFNLLIVFFKKSEILTFFNLIAALKISMCALTAGIFLSIRFKDKLKPVFVILMSLSYAFMQYNLVQVDNIMWLDGVYMLPLMLLGVYKAVNNRNIILLSVSTGLCILFNWYAAGMCCLLSIIWFALEYALKCLDTNAGFSFKDMTVSLLFYGGGMVLALLISAALFLPTVFSMTGGKSVDPIFRNEFIGNIFNAVKGYQLGASSNYAYPALYCGSAAIIGAVSLFFAKGISRKHKAVFGALIFIMLMTFFWQPLYMVFSLLRNNYSYYIRHSFVAEFALIFTAAYFFAGDVPDRTKYMTASAFGFGALLLFMEYIKPEHDLTRTYYTAILLVLTAFILSFINKKCAFSLAAVFLLLLELGFNSKIIVILGSGVNYNEGTADYYSEQQKQIDEIKSSDKGSYRITNTTQRTGAAYNDSLAFGYASIAGYTSCPDNLQLDFLDRLGYRNEGECITIVNTSMIAADSLLGVKYVLSDTPIKGLVPSETIKGYNGNTVYENPYCLPMSFVIDSYTEKSYNGENPFEFHNEIYSSLTGEKTELYKIINAERIATDTGFRYSFEMPDGNYALYGNIPFVHYRTETAIDINGKNEIHYANWLSQTVFYIPYDAGEAVNITVTSNDPGAFEEAQFYALDLDVLKTVTDKLSARSADDIKYESDRITGSIISENGGYAVLLIPYSESWVFKINGETVKPMKLGEGLNVLPLNAGSNEISAKYTVPYLKTGIIISAAAVLIIAAAAIITRKKSRVINNSIRES